MLWRGLSIGWALVWLQEKHVHGGLAEVVVEALNEDHLKVCMTSKIGIRFEKGA